MDSHHDKTVRIEDLRRWARIAERFGAAVSPKVYTEPVPSLKIAGYVIRNLADWQKYWDIEILAKHWDPKIAGTGTSEKPQNLKDLIKRIENRKKKPGEQE
jgi:hypothetical protein